MRALELTVDAIALDPEVDLMLVAEVVDLFALAVVETLILLLLLDTAEVSIVFRSSGSGFTLTSPPSKLGILGLEGPPVVLPTLGALAALDAIAETPVFVVEEDAGVFRDDLIAVVRGTRAGRVAWMPGSGGFFVLGAIADEPLGLGAVVDAEPDSTLVSFADVLDAFAGTAEGPIVPLVFNVLVPTVGWG